MEYQFIERIKYLNHRICQKNTGNCDSLAQTMNISKSCLHNYISFMKQHGAPIIYCRHLNSYKYTETDYHFTLCFAK